MRKKKILVLTISHIWYDARVYFRMVKSLLKMSMPPIIPIDKAYPSKNNIDIKLITANNNISTPPNDIEKNFSFIITPCKNHRSNILKFFIIEALKYKPDIIICIEPLTLLAGYVLKKKLKCRLVYDNHEFYAEAFAEKFNNHFLSKTFQKLYWNYEKYFAKQTDAIITVNEYLLKRYQEFHENVYLCANYLFQSSYKACLVKTGSGTDNCVDYKACLVKTEDRSPKSFDLIYIGSLAFERGLKQYLKTAKLFKDNKKPFSLLIIGSFKNSITEHYFFDFIKIHQLENTVFYKPYMPHELILNEIKASKIGVYMGDGKANKRYHKTINMKVYEYFSQSLPVIVNKLEMLSEIVNTTQAGWIIDYNSSQLYELLLQILHDDELLSQKGKLGYEYALKNLIWENQEPDLYRAVFGNANSALVRSEMDNY